MRVAFEHLASRNMIHLADLHSAEGEKVGTVVISGGVAANKFLRPVMCRMLNVRGYRAIKLNFTPVELCTKNALMVAWAGMEMFAAGYIGDFRYPAHQKVEYGFCGWRWRYHGSGRLEEER